MEFCSKCLYPDTKPDLYFVDGICGACIAFDKRKDIDWKNRRELFEALVTATIAKSSFMYDVVVPVSGGKDSYYQVKKCLDYGLRVLAVCAETDYLTPIGRRNLDNLANYCDLIRVKPDHSIRSQLCKYGLETVGDLSWPEHVTIFTIPVQIAVAMEIPLIVWGENPQNEYGGPINTQDTIAMNTRWLQEFGGLNGMRVRDVIDAGILPEDKSALYRYPRQTDRVTQIFLGQFFDWDGMQNARVAESMGFEISMFPVETHGYDYENLDNYATLVHDLFKYYKYGFGRATDLACNHIRRGRLTRKEGLEHVKYYNSIADNTGWDKNPMTYLDKPLSEILYKFNISKEEYQEYVRTFTNRKLFDVSVVQGDCVAPKPLFTIK